MTGDSENYVRQLSRTHYEAGPKSSRKAPGLLESRLLAATNCVGNLVYGRARLRLQLFVNFLGASQGFLHVFADILSSDYILKFCLVD